MNTNMLREAALALLAEERASLAHGHPGSLAGPEDPDAVRASDDEVERGAVERADETVIRVDWDQACERILHGLRGARPTSKRSR